MAENCKVFVGGLSYRTTPASLASCIRERFENAKHRVDIQSVDIVSHGDGESRGFGFVTFASPESVEQAINVMCGCHLDGRRINVEKAGTGKRSNQAKRGSRSFRENQSSYSRERDQSRGSNYNDQYSLRKTTYSRKHSHDSHSDDYRQDWDDYGSGSARYSREDTSERFSDRYSRSAYDDRLDDGRRRGFAEDRWDQDTRGGSSGRDDRGYGRDGMGFGKRPRTQDDYSRGRSYNRGTSRHKGYDRDW